MKTKNIFRVLISVILFFGLVTSNELSAQMLEAERAKEESVGPEIKFVEENLNLGKISISELKTFNEEIEFYNNGKKPLVLSQVRGCCGTRIINWPREPIAPGEKAVIEIQFRLAPRAHNVRRTITVMSNEESKQRVFRIIGEVVDE